MANRPRGAIYIGVTSDLVARVSAHRQGLVEGHTKRYRIRELVCHETFWRIEDAIAREKTLKRWRRAWKLELIESSNPTWRDLWYELIGEA